MNNRKALLITGILATTLSVLLVVQAQPPPEVPISGNLARRVTALEAVVASLQERVSDIEGNTVLELSGVLSRATINGFDTALFSGVNVQVVNGNGATNTTNGLGGL